MNKYKYPLVYVKGTTTVPNKSKPIQSKLELYDRRVGGIYWILYKNKCTINERFVYSSCQGIHPTILQVYVKTSKKSKPVLLATSDTITNNDELTAFESGVVESYSWIKEPFKFTFTETLDNAVWKLMNTWIERIQHDIE